VKLVLAAVRESLPSTSGPLTNVLVERVGALLGRIACRQGLRIPGPFRFSRQRNGKTIFWKIDEAQFQYLEGKVNLKERL